MKIFISWSGSESKRCAEALRDWLPYMNQSIQPFVSSRDILKGQRGLDRIATQLQDCSFGIVCITRSNQNAPWINFESGALSRELDESTLVPFLLDMPIKDLSGPVSQFQAVSSENENDIWEMTKTINAKCDPVVHQERLRVMFDRFLADLTGKLGEIRAGSNAEHIPARETSDILNELVTLIRDQNYRIHSLEVKTSQILESRPIYNINEPREVTISTNDSRKRKKEHALVAQINELIGANLTFQYASSGYGLTAVCSEEIMQRVRELKSEIQLIAAKHKTGVEIHSSSEREIFAPF
ncbi:toll/interleukin-1 receptor domain-containing protein [Streptomyces sp. NPDC020480]|uniref:toll/interleukin-1 receptor domain-containing protein n=1 Tax=Streptomyces sp. NPDC020480 TaxID=3365076 RepID=UPI0037AE4E87